MDTSREPPVFRIAENHSYNIRCALTDRDGILRQSYKQKQRYALSLKSIIPELRHTTDLIPARQINNASIKKHEATHLIIYNSFTKEKKNSIEIF
jgi:hypothetical protein